MFYLKAENKTVNIMIAFILNERILLNNEGKLNTSHHQHEEVSE